MNDDFFKEQISQMENGRESVMTVGHAQYVRDHVVNWQPTADKVDAVMSSHNEGIKLLQSVGQAILSDVDSWKSSIKASKKAKEDARKAKKREEERLSRLKIAEAKKAAKQKAAAEEKARLAEQKRLAAENGEVPEETRRRQRTHVIELDDEKD